MNMYSHTHKAKRFRNESQFEIKVKRPITSNTPSAISKAAAGHFESMHVRAEAAVKLEKALHQKRCHQKRHGQSKRIYREQQDAFHQRILFAGDGENRGRIGPRHGVQPKANAKPMTNAPTGVLLPFTLCRRASV